MPAAPPAPCTASSSDPGRAQIDDTVDPLILDLLDWLQAGPRPYAEVLDVWRTSCPRLPVWEEANDRGFVQRSSLPGQGPLVSLTDAGRRHLEGARRPV